MKGAVTTPQCSTRTIGGTGMLTLPSSTVSQAATLILNPFLEAIFFLKIPLVIGQELK